MTPNTVTTVKSRLQWVGYVIKIWKTENAYRIW